VSTRYDDSRAFNREWLTLVRLAHVHRPILLPRRVEYEDFIAMLRTADAPDWDGEEMTTVIALDTDGKEIGRANFWHESIESKYPLKPNEISARGREEVWVHPLWRRIGLGSRMYDYAETVTGKRAVPSPRLSHEGLNFWRKRLGLGY